MGDQMLNPMFMAMDDPMQFDCLLLDQIVG
jgi:hypothetical protein